MKKQKQKLAIVLMLILSLLAYPARFDAAESASDVQDITQKIKAQKEAIDALQKKIDIYEQKIKSKRNQAFSIKNQLSELSDSIDQTKTEMEKKQAQITELNFRLEQTKDRIEQKLAEIEKQKERIGDLVRLLHRQSDRNYVEILLSSDAFSEFFDQTQYLKSVEENMASLLKTFKSMKQKLDDEKKDLENEKKAIEQLRDQLSNTQASLEEQSTAKNVLLEATQNDEAKFQQLLKEVRSEQAQINANIISLEKELRKKLAAAGDKKLAQLSGQGFAWPVPSRTITASFHDPSYPFRRYFEHPAIDIRASQGTPLRAIGSGYVSVTHDGGLGYSYISIIHGNGLSSVYGHVSCISVKEEEFVVQGQVIGCSGGMPGTAGAGRLTTGSHLHLEIRLNGIPVNPVKYLP